MRDQTIATLKSRIASALVDTHTPTCKRESSLPQMRARAPRSETPMNSPSGCTTGGLVKQQTNRNGGYVQQPPDTSQELHATLRQPSAELVLRDLAIHLLHVQRQAIDHVVKIAIRELHGAVLALAEEPELHL